MTAEQEREAIAAWLRELCARASRISDDLDVWPDKKIQADEWSLRWAVYGDAADAIERGEHLITGFSGNSATQGTK